MQVELNWKLVCKTSELDEHLKFFNENGGVYLWLYRGKPLRVAYVGEAANYLSRLYQHMANFMAGMYTVHDIRPEQDLVKHIAQHMAGKDPEEIKRGGKTFFAAGPRDADFLFSKQFSPERIRNCNRAYLDNLSFAFAPLDKKYDAHMRRGVETTLIVGIRKIYSAMCGRDDSCQLHVKGKNGNHTIWGAISRYPSEDINLVQQSEAFASLPAEVGKIRGWDKSSGQVRLALLDDLEPVSL
ncbi:MAG: hypothetical protein KQH53_08195 [Desulfarculaceae bacterium]|nr:hypothetical protein [Desulfarculaceae bacterium]